MLIEFFLERSRIELAADGLSYKGRVLDLPTIQVSAATPEECRHQLAAAVTALLASEAQGVTQDHAGNGATTEETRLSLDAATTLTRSSDLDDSIRGLIDHSQSEPRFTDIVYEKADWVARVTINRPGAYNAYTHHTLREMAAAFRDAASDNRVAVLVLTGAGDRAFSAGSDVQQHGDEHVGRPETFRRWLNALIDAHRALRELGKPSIARINGMVAGGGNDWNLACDLAIAADHAKFIQMETKVGLASANGAAHWLPIVVGERRAREIFLTGEPISANKALLWGLVNDVVSYKQLDKTVASLCQKLVERFPETTRIVRNELAFWKDLAWDSMTKTASDLATHFVGKEASEGLRALAEKREVDYRGFRLAASATPASEPATPVAGVVDQTVNMRKRSCYSCGAQDIPASFDYCGMCGTRLL